MPQYHFHHADGQRDYDPDGVELPNDEAAQIEAVRYAGSVLKDNPKAIWYHGTWRVEVTDSNNVLLFTLITLAVDAPKPDFAHFPSPDA